MHPLPSAKPRLIYLITEDWFFCSHFIERAVAANDSGYDVAVACREGADADKIRSAGLRLCPVSFDRSGVNPITDYRTLSEITRLYRRERPDIVHHIALKPILYGTDCGIEDASASDRQRAGWDGQSVYVDRP